MMSSISNLTSVYPILQSGIQSSSIGGLILIVGDAPDWWAKVLHSLVAFRTNWVFLGCFLGFWLVDFILYFVARFFGHRLLERPWVARRVSSESLTRSEVWFARHGPVVLFASRWIPGTRVATYLTAGFLRMPLLHFVPVSFAAAALWTTAVFTVIHSLGLESMAMLRQVGAFVIISVSLGIVAAVLMVRWLSAQLKTKIGWLLSHWEFWPAWALYVPVALNNLWWSIRHRGRTSPTTASLGLYPREFFEDSKHAILESSTRYREDFTAEAWLNASDTPEECLARLRGILETNGLIFPLALKPEIGQREAGIPKNEDLKPT